MQVSAEVVLLAFVVTAAQAIGALVGMAHLVLLD